MGTSTTNHSTMAHNFLSDYWGKFFRLPFHFRDRSNESNMLVQDFSVIFIQESKVWSHWMAPAFSFNHAVL